MAEVVRMPCRWGICGEPKTGKSHWGASTVKKFDGVVMDFAGITQTKPEQRAKAQYWVSDAQYGDAYYSCQSVGLDLTKQYRYIRSWKEFLDAVEYLKKYPTTKENKRIWMIIDDTFMWRFHCAIYVQEQAGHAAIAQDDWIQAGTIMNGIARFLESKFNLMFINQMKDEWVGGASTGKFTPAWYPTNQPYAFDLLTQLTVDKTVQPYVQHMEVIANRWNWSCTDAFISDIINPNPELVMNLCKVPVELR